ncbi:gas vesicle protein [Streptodolium elevatio]|uniref:Gas vesicle protein GvpJ n=1 Tax=Streptodolium elevatio TaxID=3157996 RepID=A0ABV3DVF0_9ACTN
MTQGDFHRDRPVVSQGGWPGGNLARQVPQGQGGSANLADILERVLDKGIVIAGDIKINLVDVELLTIKLRLRIASVDRAKEMGIDWWESDPSLSSKAADRRLVEENEQLRRQLRQRSDMPGALESADPALVEENRRLREQLAEQESGREEDS